MWEKTWEYVEIEATNKEVYEGLSKTDQTNEAGCNLSVLQIILLVKRIGWDLKRDFAKAEEE